MAKKQKHWLYKEMHPILVITVAIITIFVGAALFFLVIETNRLSQAEQQHYQSGKILFQQQTAPNGY